MKKNWITDAVMLLLLVVMFLAFFRLHLSPNVVIATGAASFLMALWLGVDLGKYFFLGYEVSDKDLKNDTVFTVEGIVFSDHVLLRTVCPSKKRMVEISDKREFDIIKRIFEKEGSFALVKLKKGRLQKPRMVSCQGYSS